ncbi:hypothetical protein H4S08_001450 [Coemansia sp. RSA 1365]|nr:hypothetical protein H4S08_001450 [Coemansia sp. RSA 1365]
MRASKALCRALAATTVVLTTTALAAADPLASDTDKHIAVRRELHPRGLLDGLAGILNVGRAGENDGTNGNNNLVGKADETGENTDTGNDDNKSTDNDEKTTNNTDDSKDDSTTQKPTDDSTSDKDTTTKDDNSSDKDTTSDRSTEDSDKTSDDSEKTSEHHTPTDTHKDTDTDTPTDADTESDPKSSTKTKTKSDTHTEPTDSPTPTDSSSMVVVTATRPGVTTTTMIGPAPTIDDANGDKADVGSSGNLTSIIVASSVTAAALLLCTVLFYLYRRRRNRMTHGEEDFFAKGPLDGSPLSRAGNTVATTSPFIPPAQSSDDGYTKPEDSAFYGAGAVSNDRRTEESFRSQSAVNDNTHLLANQHYRSAATAPVTAATAASAPYAQPATNPHYRPQGTAPPAPPILQAAATASYGARPPLQRMQVAGYPNVSRMPVQQLQRQQQQQQQSPQQHNVFSLLQHNHGSTGP